MGIRTTGLVPVIGIVLSVTFTPAGMALPPQEVFKRVSPSVVFIKDIECTGSGVVLERDGLILSNYHVVSSPLAMEITAGVEKGGRVVPHTFSSPKVVGVHPEYDLALIKVDTQGLSLIPASTAGGVPKTGDPCYAVGHPGSSGGVLRDTITEGRVSATDRVIERLKYIQTTAAINPGNSGGALCNDQGDVIGIVTFKIIESERLGFAIPMQYVSRREFIPVASRRIDKKLAADLCRIGVEVSEASRRCGPTERRQLLELAQLYFRLAVSEDPTCAQLFYNVGTNYAQLGQKEVARPYLEKALELDPNHAFANKVLGAMFDEEGNSEKAVTLWENGLAGSDRQGVSDCAENLACLHFNRKQYAMAAYYVQWANAVSKAGPGREKVRNVIYSDSMAHLDDKQVAYLTKKTSGFSAAQAEAFGKSAEISPSPLAAAGDDAVTPTMLEKIMEEGTTPGPDGLKLKLPDEVIDTRLAFGGAFLVIRFKNLSTIGVVNLAKAGGMKAIPLPEPDALMAPAGRSLYFYLPGKRQFEKWSLTSFQRVSSRPSRILGHLEGFETGLLRPDQAVVLARPDDKASQPRVYLLDLATMQPRLLPESACPSVVPGRAARLRVDAALDRFLVMSTGSCLITTVAGPGGEATTRQVGGASHGLATLGDGNGLIFTTRGRSVDGWNRTRHQYDRSCLLAIHAADAFLEFEAGNVCNVRSAKSEQTLKRIPLSCEAPGKNTEKEGDLCVDRQFVGSGPVNRLAIISNQEKTLYIHEMGLNTVSPSGASWTKKLSFPEGTTIVVEDAPEGLTLDAAEHVLTWAIPDDKRGREFEVLLSIKEPGKDEYYHRELIQLAPTRETAPTRTGDSIKAGGASGSRRR